MPEGALRAPSPVTRAVWLTGTFLLDAEALRTVLVQMLGTGLTAGTRVWIVAGVTDMRRGFVGLSAMVQTALRKSVFRSRVCVSREARRSDQASVVGWRRAVLVCEAAGAWAIYLAAGHQRHGFVDASAIIDAAGRHRLAAAGAQLRSTDGGVSNRFLFFSCAFLFCCIQCLINSRQWLLRTTLSPISTHSITTN
jgi:hypothetical protein